MLTGNLLNYLEMGIGIGRNLRQMSHADYLMIPAQSPQLFTNYVAAATADVPVHPNL